MKHKCTVASLVQCWHNVSVADVCLSAGWRPLNEGEQRHRKQRYKYRSFPPRE